jgi:hypothetical protein
MPPRLSVLIDTCNHEKYVGEAIKSVLNQEGLGDDKTVEILVIDDGSTDRTGEIVRSFGDVLRYYFKPNGGQASAFNFGIPLCRGDVICFLDGDDWWHPKKLETVLEAFVEDDARCAVGHAIVEVDEVHGKESIVGPDKPIILDFTSQHSIALFHKFSCCLGTSRLAIRRSLALSLLDIPEKLIFEADEYMFTLLPTLGKVVILPRALTYYRIHGQNLYQHSRFSTLQHGTDARLLKRASIYECLCTNLPIELKKRGCETAAVDLLLGPLQVQTSRLKLMTTGGTPLQNFRSERRAAKLFERSNSTLDKIVLFVSLSLALLLPPKWYFHVRQRYTNFLRGRGSEF